MDKEQRAFNTPQPSPILGRALCLTAKDSPVPGRVSHLSERFNDALNLNSDTDTMVAKISSMFPTVSETHIRILLKKFHNREAVVISALQVEKHPLVTPGPVTMSPSAAQLSKGAAGVPASVGLAKNLPPLQEYYLPFTATPNSSPSLFRPPSGTSSYFGTTLKTSDGHVTRQHSPKMKLKYLKSIFPKADEMMILDILTNNDNNVQKVSAELINRGFEKTEPNKKVIAPPPPPPPPLVLRNFVSKTNNEKLLMVIKCQKLYPMVAERLITIALESVYYDDTLVDQILDSVLAELDQPVIPLFEPREVKRVTLVEPRGPGIIGEARALSPPPPSRRPKPWTQPLKPILKKNTGAVPKYRSNYNAPRRGPNPHYRQGPREALLLEDYMPWNGPNPDLRGGPFLRPEGPAPRNRPSSHARGPAGVAKGPQSLAKGSSYHKNKKSGKGPK